MPTMTMLYSMQEVSQHNTDQDCWVVIDGKAGLTPRPCLRRINWVDVVVELLKVYDVTSYLDDHPGGDDVFIAAAGKDAKQEFEDAEHSMTARELMETFYIGELDPSAATLPEPEVSSEEPSLTQKLGEVTLRYWAVPVAIVGISVAVALFLRKKK